MNERDLQQIITALEPRIRQIVEEVIAGHGSQKQYTYAQAASKLGISVRTLRRWTKRRLVQVVELSSQKKFITDAEIQRVIAKRTRRAVI